MSSKKWLILFVVTAFAVAILIGAFNMVTDPFGVFGDRFFNWFSYDITNNPRTAKFTYLDMNHNKYDSYIVGCSSTSSFPVDAFNKYLDASFYNTIVYGADMLDSEQMIDYIIDNYGAENIVLNVYIDNAIVYDEESNPYTHCMPSKLDGSSNFKYYARFLFANPEYGIKKIKYYGQRSYLSHSFCIFDETTGSYDKRRRDIEPISDLEHYYEAYPVFVNYPTGNYTMPYISQTMDSIKRIKQKCDENDVNLIIVTAPVYADYMDVFNIEDVKNFYSSIAEISDFWDFSYTSVSFEPRYFYDGTHFRNNIGYMAAARIFDDDSIYIPEDFGYHVTSDNAEEYFRNYGAEPEPSEDYTVSVPILMYHHISDEVDGNSMVISPEDFEKQIISIRDAGYNTVGFEDILAYVEHGADLPENPIIITFDDGYESNYTYAYPILKEYDYTATIFVIGSSVGKNTYKNTSHEIIPHFGAAETREMISSGVIDIQSHTYDMHQNQSYESSEARVTMCQLENETEADYISAVRDDIKKNREVLEDITGNDVYVLAYPQGYYNDTLQAVVKEEGIKISMSTNEGINVVIKGLDQSLLAMKRINPDGLTADQLLEKLFK